MAKNRVQYVLFRLSRVALVAFVVIFLPLAGFGVCSRPDPTVRCEFLNSTAVFIGTVISTREEPARSTRPDDNDGWIYTLTVQKRFRGAFSNTVEVYTENASVRFPLDNGKQYLLFAFKYRGRLQIFSCGNSAPVSDAKKSIELLEKVKIPEDAVIEGRISFSGMPDTGAHTAGILIVIKGDGGTFRTITDSNGWFHLQVPPGKYSATVRNVHGMTASSYDLSYDNPDQFVARKGHCSGLQFLANSD